MPKNDSLHKSLPLCSAKSPGPHLEDPTQETVDLVTNKPPACPLDACQMLQYAAFLSGFLSYKSDQISVEFSTFLNDYSII